MQTKFYSQGLGMYLVYSTVILTSEKCLSLSNIFFITSLPTPTPPPTMWPKTRSTGFACPHMALQRTHSGYHLRATLSSKKSSSDLYGHCLSEVSEHENCKNVTFYNYNDHFRMPFLF